MKRFENMVNEVGLTTYVKDKKILRTVIKSSEDIVKFCRDMWDEDLLIRECFYVVFLNRGNYTISWTKLSEGSTAGTVVDTKMIAKMALDVLAHNVILCHNHPSGNTKPSEADISITKKIKEALKSLEIDVIDHIIITDESYFSFSDEGIL